MVWKEFCVIVYDCAKWKNVVPAVETWKADATAHHQFIQLFIQNDLVGTLDKRWNSHDGDTDEIKSMTKIGATTQLELNCDNLFLKISLNHSKKLALGQQIEVVLPY